MTIDSIALWHKRARPEPDHASFNVQLGCHIEEFCEMLESLASDDARTRNRMSSGLYEMLRFAEGLKNGAFDVYIDKPVDFIDAIADQVVTAVGVAHCAKMKPAKAIDIVNTSNWSKFDEHGEPIFNSNGKIAKGPRYTPPHLDECV